MPYFHEQTFEKSLWTVTCLIEVPAIMTDRLGQFEKSMEGQTGHQRMIVAITPTGWIGGQRFNVFSGRNLFLLIVFYDEL